MTAGSWGEDCMKHLMAQPEVQRGVGHMCRFGVAAPKSACAGGGRQLVRKPTRWVSSSPEILKR
eukprot:4539183-Alexandrium_andersonii.AAC.1